MPVFIESKEYRGFRLAVIQEGKEVGRARLYLIENDLHEEPYGLIEDVAVLEAYQGMGIGGDLLAAAIAKAKAEGCYKIIAMSRHEGRDEVHAWYIRAGFEEHGTEFRMNLKAA